MQSMQIISPENGYEVWMEDYPAYGKSRGERTEQKIHEQALQEKWRG